MPTDLAVHHFGLDPKDAPTVVILHGAVESAHCWADAIQRWSSQFHIVAPDARGHGASPRMSAPEMAFIGTEVMTTDAIAVLSDVFADTGRPALVIGHSMGARIAAFAAAAVPHTVAGLVLEDPPWWVPEEGPNPWLSRDVEFDDPLTDPDASEATIDELAAAMATLNPAWATSELRPLALAARQVDQEMLQRRAFEKRRPWTPTIRQLAHGRCSVPTMLVTGTGAVIVEESARSLLSEVAPEVSVIVIEDAGHCVRRDQAEAYHSYVDHFLATHAVR